MSDGLERARARRPAAHEQSLELASTPSAASISRGSFSRSNPTTSVRGPSLNSSSSATPQRLPRRRRCARRRAARAAGGRRLRAGPATAPARTRRPRRSNGSGAPHEALGRGQRDRGVVGLVRAVQRQEHVGILRAGTAEVDEPAADREHVARHAEVDVAAEDAPVAARASKIAWISGSVSPSTSVAPGLTMPAFSCRDLLARRAEVVDVVDAHVRDDGDLARRRRSSRPRSRPCRPRRPRRRRLRRRTSGTRPR